MDSDDDDTYTPTYCGPSYGDLPMEIILHIMNYLHPSDIQMASLSCRRWFEASQYPNFARQLVLHFSRCHLSDVTPPLQQYHASVRNYAQITLSQVDFGASTEQFWTRFADSVNALIIRNCDLREKSLKNILMQLECLRSLEIENCRELFMPGRLFENDKQAICAACKGIESLALINNRYLSDALFARFVVIMPRLQHLDLSGCHISFHRGLYKKFYPDRQKEPSESVLTFHYISQFIECEASALKSFNFSSTLIDGEALQTLANIEQLQLDTLQLRSCDQLTNAGIIALVERQHQLQHLDLSYSVRLTDPGLIAICNNLSTLKVLKLRRCRALSDVGIREIVALKELEVLDISECEAVTSRGVTDGIGLNVNRTLQELYVSALNICQLAIMKIAENFPELRVLDLSFCKNGVTNLALQWICKHLVWLRVLNLEYCDKITDAAMTGIDMRDQIERFEMSKKATDSTGGDKENEEQGAPIEVINDRPALYTISLRSRAEQDIVNDAKRKEILLAMYEHKGPITDYSGFSISSLRGLRVLNLTACNRISDVSLKYNFRLAELKEVSFAKCQQVTVNGIGSMIRNCTSLANINLSECHNINDRTIELITIHLPRLTHLYLERCIQLSDHSLDYMAVNCEHLRHLDVRGCRSMCAQPNLRLVNLSSLKYVAMSKPGPYMDGDEVTYKQPKPPPMPMGF